MHPKQPIIYPIGTTGPLFIDNWQRLYAETYGNRPSLLFTESTTDDNGLVCEREFSDVQVYRYYANPPANTKLNRIKIMMENPLLKEVTVTIKP